MNPSNILTALFFSFLFFSTTSFSQGRSVHNDDEDQTTIEIKIIEIKSPSCNGVGDGQVTVEVIGGEAPYTYNWNTFPNQYNKTAKNLSSGIYFVYVEDAEGNSSFKSIHVDDPNTSLLAEKNKVDINELELTASMQGPSSFQYEINSNISENDKIGDLPVGIHKIKITDNNNCTMVQYIQVFEVSKSGQEKSIKSTATYSNDKGKKILVSNLIPIENSDPQKQNYSIKLDKQKK